MTQKKRERPQNRHLRPIPENLGVTRLPAGMEATKAFRFTLPSELKQLLESLPKRERDQLMREALERHQRVRPGPALKLVPAAD